MLVVAESSADPDVAPFVGDVRVGECLVLVCEDGVRLGFLSPIEREEAAASGLELLSPEDLEVPRAARESSSRGDFWSWVLGRAFLATGLSPSRVAVAGHQAVGVMEEALARLRTDGWSFTDGQEVVRRLRKLKSAAEIEEMRAVAGITGDAFRRLAAILRAAEVRGDELWSEGSRLRVGHLRREVGVVMAANGLGQPEGSLIAPGAQGAVPHNTGDDETVLSARESLIVDLFPARRLFADCTRTFCVGTPPRELATAWGAVREALDLAYARTVAGTRGWDVQRAVCRHFEDLGYPTVLTDESTTRGYVHGLAHGVGYEVHEYPEFRRESSPEAGRIEEGDLVTLEPGLYDPEAGWAVRLEDMVRIGPDGPENLTSLPYEMDPRAWNRA
ncbi:MAG: M24 family metallopeptidase [Acidobacteriota bacterium]|nr:M24 family metallopeptidase [Acidobacteriota bacterium]